MEAIALLEVQAMVTAIVGLDAMVKAADVKLIHVEKRLGGRLVTLGSDAHGHEDIARGFDKFRAHLKECGFTHYHYYKNRQPQAVVL